jgi:MFS family permease
LAFVKFNMMLIISLSALLLSVLLIQVGSGSLGPLDALSGKIFGFSPTEIGVLGSAHFIGLFIGCFVNPWLIRRSGHTSTFAVMAAASAISALLHPIFINVYAWSLLRILTGFAIAGAYTVIESWLQAKLNNNNRGRVFSIYRMVDMIGTLMAQGIIAALSPGTYVAYNIIAMIACLSLLPLALTQSVPPEMPKQQRFKPLYALALSPLAGLGVLATGLTNSAFRMIGPVYADEIGLDAARIALFLSVGVLGGALMQIPAGIISDRFNRRFVLIAFSIAAIAVCYTTGLTSSLGMNSSFLGFVMVFLFGLTTMPIYSICAAHASDFAAPSEMVDLSASLILIYAMGAIVSPVFSGYLIDHFGAGAMFIYIGVVHTILVLYSLWRMSKRPASTTTRYRYVPRTTLFIGSILRNRNRDDTDT